MKSTINTKEEHNYNSTVPKNNNIKHTSVLSNQMHHKLKTQTPQSMTLHDLIQTKYKFLHFFPNRSMVLKNRNAVTIASSLPGSVRNLIVQFVHGK